MRFSVYIVTLPGYPHSQCFDEVAETLCDGLISLGHEAAVTTSLVPGTRHIVLGANLLADDRVGLPPDSILYNLEQLEKKELWEPANFIAFFRDYRVWDYSPDNVGFLKENGIDVRAVLPISYHEGLTRIPRAPVQDIDVLFVGSMNPRREAVLRAMHGRGLKVVHLFNKYGAARDAYIARSKVLLNLHYYTTHILEQVRISYYLANRIPVLSEVSADAATDREWAKGVFFSSYEQLVDNALKLCADAALRERWAAAGFEFFKTRRLAPHLKAALAATP